MIELIFKKKKRKRNTNNHFFQVMGVYWTLMNRHKNEGNQLFICASTNLKCFSNAVKLWNLYHWIYNTLYLHFKYLERLIILGYRGGKKVILYFLRKVFAIIVWNSNYILYYMQIWNKWKILMRNVHYRADGLSSSPGPPRARADF